MESKDNKNNFKKRHIFIVSDATGSTCEMVVKAALSQFKTTDAILHKLKYVRTELEVKNVVLEAMAVNGIITYTLVSHELCDIMNDEGRKSAVPTIDVLGPLLSRFTDYLDISPMAIPGLFKHLDKAYFQRIECIDFAVKHDDGTKIEDIAKAELVLVGPSRTSKTPISIYLAYRDYLVANVPIIQGIESPKELFEIAPKHVIGLFVSPYRLKTIREVRATRYPHIDLSEYINLEQIQLEMTNCMKLYVKNKWNIVDVTAKSIEEAATEIMRLFSKRKVDNTILSDKM